jgi:hypothetical protein
MIDQSLASSAVSEFAASYAIKRQKKPDLWRGDMTESVYKIIEVVGTSSESWEKAAAAAVQRASKTLRDLRIAEFEE